ncbi:MAG: hypothetical protein Q9170_000291 [Blastenia crenularia]
MDAIIQSQLDRVEAALNTLVSSIESYKPSVPAAIDLLAADIELQKAVKQLAQHQAHYAHILHLRSVIDVHDQQRKAALTLLADTRKDLLSSPATAFPETSRNVPYTELLDYASRISRYTVPPAFRERPAPLKPMISTDEAVDVAPIVNGISDAVAEARDVNTIANGEVPPAGDDKGVGVSSLELDEKQWLNPWAQTLFAPWPTEDVIKKGALGHIQVMLEQGGNPSSGETAGGGTGGGGGQEEMNEWTEMNQSTEQAPTEIGEADAHEGARRADVQRREEKPKVFKGLDLDEDSDDD